MCDTTVKDVKGLKTENLKVLCFPWGIVPDMTRGIMGSVAENPILKKIIYVCMYSGTNDIVKQQISKKSSLTVSLFSLEAEVQWPSTTSRK